VIPADHISFNGDGTAWVVTERMMNTGLDAVVAGAFDRRCDTCGGTLAQGQAPDDRCPDCGGTGRHTFTVEVGTYTPNGIPDDPSIAIYCERRRVSVVPGMVLPIVEHGTEANGYPFITKGLGWVMHHIPKAKAVRSVITLPPAAAPGMWAVKLAVRS
jgi:hypothetical protein